MVVQNEMFYKKLRKVISSYKGNFTETDKKERYKWEAIGWYKQNWKIDADDFAEMLKVSFGKTQNLLSSGMYYPYKMIVEFANAEPEEMRKLFSKLHNEEISFAERYLAFREGCEERIELIKKQNPESNRLHHYQDLRAVMTYLTFEYPDKYFMFKSTMYAVFRDRVGFIEDDTNKKSAVHKLEQFTDLCNLLLAEIENDSALVEMHKSRLDDNCYKDEALHLLTVDIMYYGSVYMEEADFFEDEIGAEDTNYWPTKEAYDPKLGVEDWYNFLLEDIKDYPSTLDMLKAMVDLGGETTCARLGTYLGEHPSSCISRGNTFGRRVKKKYNLPPCMDDNVERYFPVPFVGRSVVEDGKNHYAWKIRPELEEALRLINEDRKVLEDKYTDVALNSILYGPPGTGKTYYTVIYAVAIIENKELKIVEAEARESYEDVLYRYNGYKAQGYIEATTFHQSYGYEEFIEGIKPVVSDDESKDGDDIKYKIEPGIFKKFCEQADEQMVSFDDAWTSLIKCAKENGNRYVFRRRTGTPINADLKDDQTFVVNWSGGTNNVLKKSKIKQQWATSNYEDRDTLSGGTRWLFDAYQAVIDEMISKYRMTADNKSQTKKNYVFIIDEINRGNIAKIFGELITLVEDTKRTGMPEGMTVMLPYSQKNFGVPKNMYIVGTMNTADRSIATIDTALRRRFLFREMLPNTNILADINVEDLSIRDMLENMNKKISVLYDREHTIGHAYFLPLRKIQTVDKLAEIFINSIIPLLQEYFYDDYEKIRLILGDNKKENDEEMFIIAKKNDYSSLFGHAELEFDSDYSYEINYSAFKTIDSYRSI